MTDNSKSCVAESFFASLANSVAVMGILNVTPDSFSGDGVHASVEKAVIQARTMETDGCHILDIGGESTRPGSDRVSEDEERKRVMPVIAAVAAALNIPISIDTYKAAIAAEAVRNGAHIVNDIWGLQHDPDMAATVAEAQCGLVIMHNRAKADQSVDIIAEINAFFEKSLAIAQKAGIPSHLIALDPGIGFGKTIQQNLVILNRMETFHSFGRPLLIGLSRKRFIGEALGTQVDDRLIGTVAANLFAWSKGASIIRVHDVADHVKAIRMLTTIRNESYG